LLPIPNYYVEIKVDTHTYETMLESLVIKSWKKLMRTVGISTFLWYLRKFENVFRLWVSLPYTYP